MRKELSDLLSFTEGWPDDSQINIEAVNTARNEAGSERVLGMLPLGDVRRFCANSDIQPTPQPGRILELASTVLQNRFELRLLIPLLRLCLYRLALGRPFNAYDRQGEVFTAAALGESERLLSMAPVGIRDDEMLEVLNRLCDELLADEMRSWAVYDHPDPAYRRLHSERHRQGAYDLQAPPEPRDEEFQPGPVTAAMGVQQEPLPPFMEMMAKVAASLGRASSGINIEVTPELELGLDLDGREERTV